MFPRNRFLLLLRYFCFICVFVILLDYFGVFLKLFEQKFDYGFLYPYNGDVYGICYKLRRGQNVDVSPINNQTFTYRHNNENKCKDELQNFLLLNLVIVVKSKTDHFDRRNAIRNSWGFEKRFSDVMIRTIFTLGVDRETYEGKRSGVQKLIDLEAANYKDIIQFNFIDEYFNNTRKTVNGMRWLKENCMKSKFYLFVDDDYYVSIKNILSYLRNPLNYPEYLEEYKEQLRKLNQRRLNEIIINETKNDKGKIEYATRTLLNLNQNIELPPDIKLFAGYVFNSAPHRHKSSKWYVSLEEYQYDKWPTYVTAGVFILSREALLEMYCASLYTQHFRFDDIFLGIVALKSHIEPLHSDEFYYYKASYSDPTSYKYVLATHGYENSPEMMKVWGEVRAAGYA